MIRRVAFEAVKGFDERYFLFCEDTDLCKRLGLAGWEIWYSPEATVNHHIGESEMASSINTLFQRHRSMWIYSMTFHQGSFLKNIITLLGVSSRFLFYTTLYFSKKIMKFLH